MDSANECFSGCVSLGKALHLRINKEDVEELVEEHSKDLKTEGLEELKK